MESGIRTDLVEDSSSSPGASKRKKAKGGWRSIKYILGMHFV